jgi:hypothetical protein
VRAVAWLADLGFALARAGTPTTDPLALGALVLALAAACTVVGSRSLGHAVVASTGRSAASIRHAVGALADRRAPDSSSAATSSRLSVSRR